MARDAVAVTALTLDAENESATGVAINTTNGAAVAAEHTQKLILYIHNTTDSEKDVTIKAGIGQRAGLGDLVMALAAETVYIVPCESARFVQANGDINLDFETGMTGTVAAYRLPKGT